jgi:hypothetical protein
VARSNGRQDCPNVTFYERGLFQFSSFFLTGLQKLDELGEISLTIRRRGPQPPVGRIALSLLLDIEMGGDSFSICIDTRDQARPDADIRFRDADGGHAFDPGLLERVRWYFKVNYNAQAIGRAPELQEHKHKIIPAGVFTPVRSSNYLRYLALPDKDPENGWARRDAFRRLRHIRRTSTMDGVSRIRSGPRREDLFFVVPYYGEPGLEEMDEYRVELAQALKALKGIEATIGLVGNLPPALSDLKLDLMPMHTHVARIGQARLAVYIRGVHNCLSFKLGQYLAFGLPLVGQPLFNDLGVAEVAQGGAFDHLCHEAPAEIADAVGALLGDRAALGTAANASGTFYDNHGAPVPTMRRILGHALQREPTDEPTSPIPD